MIEVLTNQRELQIESNKVRAYIEMVNYEGLLNGSLRTLHSVHGLVLVQHLVVLRKSNQEHEGGYILKAVDPLLTFTPRRRWLAEAERVDV